MKNSLLSTSTDLKANGLCFSYEGRQIIQDASFALKAGTLTALVGPNGAGKSTLLHLLQGRLSETKGNVDCRCEIALMPQRAAIDWTFPITVKQMVRLGKSGRSDRNDEQNINETLERVGMLEMSSRRLSRLSGGQQQRVLLARALMQQAGVLLLDEPCSAIDPPTRESLLTVMRRQAREGRTLLVSSHDWGRALDGYDRVVVLDRKVLANGTPGDVRDKLTDFTCMMGTTCCE